jgi:hypothetical protein
MAPEIKVLNELVTELTNKYRIASYEALQIAVKIQNNRAIERLAKSVDEFRKEFKYKE